MALSAFKKGVVLGAASVLLLGGLVAVVVAWTVAPGDDPPEPTATRVEAVGRMTQTEPQLCVEGAGGAGEATPRLWCGLAQPAFVAASGVTVGDDVVGTVVEVETDPGSGSAFAVWESLTSTK